MGNSHEYARKHLASRVVVCGDTVEFYEYKNPIYIDFERQRDVVKENLEGEKGKREEWTCIGRVKCSSDHMVQPYPTHKILDADLCGNHARYEEV